MPCHGFNQVSVAVSIEGTYLLLTVFTDHVYCQTAGRLSFLCSGHSIPTASARAWWVCTCTMHTVAASLLSVIVKDNIVQASHWPIKS